LGVVGHEVAGTLARLLKGKTRVKADMALRLSEAFGVDAEMWLGMQAQRDIWVASRKRRKKIRSLAVSRRARGGWEN
jgi:plasmid maintenance system antidote protein VapI